MVVYGVTKYLDRYVIAFGENYTSRSSLVAAVAVYEKVAKRGKARLVDLSTGKVLYGE